MATLTVLAAVLRFYRLGHQGFWFDEGNTALLVHMSPGKMLGLIPQSESTPPLYYCIAWVWARIFGYGEVGLRSLSAMAGVLVVPVAYGAGARLISRRAGLVAAALAAFNPLLIWYSQEARSYELLVLFSGLSLLTFAGVLERPAPRAAGAWVIASVLALATHYYAILLVIPEAIWLLVVHRRRRPVQVALAVIALCGLALIPLAISQNGTGASSWIHHEPLARRLREIAPQFVIGFGSPAYGVLEPVALGLAVLGLVLVAVRSDRFERRGALLAGGLALAGLILNLILVGGGIDDLLTRNMLVLWIPAALVVAAGFAASRARLVGALAAAALCGIGIVAAVGVARERNLQRPDWRPVAGLLGAAPNRRSPDPDPALPRPAASLPLHAGSEVHAGARSPSLGGGRDLLHLPAQHPLLLVGIGLQPPALPLASELRPVRLRPRVAGDGQPIHGPAHEGNRRFGIRQCARRRPVAADDALFERRASAPALKSCAVSASVRRR